MLFTNHAAYGTASSCMANSVYACATMGTSQRPNCGNRCVCVRAKRAKNQTVKCCHGARPRRKMSRRAVQCSGGAAYARPRVYGKRCGAQRSRCSTNPRLQRVRTTAGNAASISECRVQQEGMAMYGVVAPLQVKRCAAARVTTPAAQQQPARCCVRARATFARQCSPAARRC